MHVGKEQQIVLALRWAKAVSCQMLHSLHFISFYRARTKNNSFGSYFLIAAHVFPAKGLSAVVWPSVSKTEMAIFQ